MQTMNWTSVYAPIEGVKYIVETDNGNIFPAHIINGTWWNTERAFTIEGVKRWIVYPEGEEPNDLIAPEILLKYLLRDFRKMKEIAQMESEKVTALREFNYGLVNDFNQLYKTHEDLKADSGRKEDELSEKINELTERIQELVAERDALKDLLSKQESVNSYMEQSKELLKENKQMKTFLRSIMNTCDMMRELEIA